MACKNEQCRCRNWCWEEIQERNDPEKCERARVIASWWKAKVAGERDPDEDFGEEDFDE